MNKDIQAATKGTWAGTDQLVDDLIDDSKHVFGWRASRAALLAGRNIQDRVWMTTDQFNDWRAIAKKAAKLRGDPAPRAPELEAIGVNYDQAARLAKGMAVRSTIALACAHYLAGFQLPIPADDPEAFAAWFEPRFGGADQVNRWLQLTPGWISARLQGFETVKGERSERTPPAHLIRALDWIITVGPVCPYGEIPPVEIYPGQMTQ